MPRRMALDCLPILNFLLSAGGCQAVVVGHQPDLLASLSDEWLFLQTMAMQAHLGFPAAAAWALAVWDYLELPPKQNPAHRWPTYVSV